ncbi:hypothetical protein [Bradyrhizobium guangdongense]
MRKIVLMAAMVLVSASAQAGGSRSLSLAAANEQAPASQSTTAPLPATTQVSEAAPVAAVPVYVDHPPVVSTTPAAAPVTITTPPSAPVATRPAPKTTARADKPRHKRRSTESRIIAELHRHGIYW